MARSLGSAQEFAAAGIKTAAPATTLTGRDAENPDQKLIGDNTLTEAYASPVGTIGDRARREIRAGQRRNRPQDQVRHQTGPLRRQYGRRVYQPDMFKQYYNANAQLLKTATDMFDALLSIR